MFERLFKIISYDLGIDLGTSNTLIDVVGKGIAVREPTVIARNKKTKEVVAVGNDAKKMIGRTPVQLETVRALKDGVIADFDATVSLLTYFFKKLHQTSGWNVKIPKPRVAIGIPTGITEVERKAVADAAYGAGAREVNLIEEPMATAIGAKLPVFEATGALIVNIGGGTTELAVVSLGGIVMNKALRIAGDEMDEAIINFLRLKYSMLIGLPTAEELKIQIGSVYETKNREEKQMVIRGRDLSTGLPRSIRVNSSEIREALAPIINQILSAIGDIVEQTPPELLGDITQRGIFLAGGVAQLPGFPELVTEAIKMPCELVKEPTNSVVKGCAMILENENLLKKVKINSGLR